MEMRLIIFQHGITFSGGSERITLEEQKYFSERGIESTIATFYYNDTVFNKSYRPTVHTMGPQRLSRVFAVKFLQKVYSLRKFIKTYRPGHIFSVGEEGCVYTYLATLFTGFKYSGHIAQTIFWDVYDPGDKSEDRAKFLDGRYSLMFRSGYQEVRNSTVGHLDSLPQEIPRMSVLRRGLIEILGLLTFIAVRKAEHLYVHSQKMKWEVQKMYKRESFVLKGAYPRRMLNRSRKTKPVFPARARGKKVILSICRLVPKKRVDLIIRAFGILARDRNDVVLVIGGTGEAEKDLKGLADELDVSAHVVFAGFIDESHLYDYYNSCDAFVSADHADFDIATYLALGCLKKCVWSVENECDDDLVTSNLVFPADVAPESFAQAMDLALRSRRKVNFDVEKYTWENYFETISGIDRLVKSDRESAVEKYA